MTQERKSKIGDAEYRNLIEQSLSALSHYLVGFALPSTNAEPLDASLGGSGTLVTIDNVYGILTADHVIESLKKRQLVGLILPSLIGGDPHRPTFDIKESICVSLPDRGEASIGPDLGLLVPPARILESLRARKSFYNLSKRREFMLTKRPPRNRGIWTLSGIADEWVSDGPPERGYSRIKIFRGGLGAGIVTREYTKEQFDYLEFGALYNDLYEGPDSFEGVSGGSLWQILVERNDTNWKIADSMLSGVAFYQSCKKRSEEGIVRDIVCHGSQSIYRELVDYVRAQLPT